MSRAQVDQQSLPLPDIPPYQPPPATTQDLDYAELPIIDISALKQPSITSGTDTENTKTKSEIRQKLAQQVRDAMFNAGFFYVVGHGYSEENVNRIFSIADIPFSAVSDQEKKEYAGKMLDTGSYQGYKLRNYWHIDNGVRDQLEHYNINRNVTLKPHPPSLRPYLPEIATFAKFCHEEILHEVLRLFAIGLGLPEEELVGLHGFEEVGETYVRFMKYYPRSEEEETKTNNVWLKGHTDFGTVTILWSQPISALQILSPDGKWRWVRHIPNAVVVNAGDAMDFLTEGKYKGTIHRVVQPPVDQRTYTRLGVFYFCMTDDDVRLESLFKKAKTKVGEKQKDGENDKDGEKDGGKEELDTYSSAPTMRDWRRARTAAYGRSELTKTKNSTTVEEEVFHGIVVKHYS